MSSFHRILPLASIVLSATFSSLFADDSSNKRQLRVESLGKLPHKLTHDDERNGTVQKWNSVRKLLGESADRVVVKQLGGSLGGNTSVRNSSPLVWKDKGYFRRARDLGQVFSAPHDFQLDSLVLRTGNDTLAFLPGAAGAEVFVQFFKVTGDPVVDDNGTPQGTDATHGFSKNHRCDDTVVGVDYKSIAVVSGGYLPDLGAEGDGKLTYLRFHLGDVAALHFQKGRQYAFMVGFVSAAPKRNFTLANRNLAGHPGPATINGAGDLYGGGWGLRREGSGANPPLKVPGETPPNQPSVLKRLRVESSFPSGDARYDIPPTCEGHPDVDTYRDLEFYLIEG